MPAQSAAEAVTGDPAWLSPAVRPGEMLLEEFSEALGWTQVEAARRLGVSVSRLNELVLGKRGITADPAQPDGRHQGPSPGRRRRS